MSIRAKLESHKSSLCNYIRRRAEQFVRRHKPRNQTAGDIAQTISCALLQACGQFDPHRGAESTFAKRIIDNTIASLVRASRAKKRSEPPNGRSLNENISDGDGNSVERAATIDAATARRHTGRVPRNHEELIAEVTKAIEDLPEDLKPLAELLTVMPRYLAAQQLGRSRRQVDNDATRIRKRFEDRGLLDFV